MKATVCAQAHKAEALARVDLIEEFASQVCTYMCGRTQTKSFNCFMLALWQLGPKSQPFPMKDNGEECNKSGRPHERKTLI